MAMVTPNHCHRLSRSPKKVMPPMSTQMGRVALIGPTMVRGRFLSPK